MNLQQHIESSKINGPKGDWYSPIGPDLNDEWTIALANMSPIQIARFWSRVKTDQDFHCWEWTGQKSARGYGRYAGHMAHRLAYELVNGPIADGLVMRHKCDNPSCCNPKHLVPGTSKQNAQDAVLRDRSSRGVRNGRSKLSVDQVRHILRNPEHLRVRDLASKFGVSPATVSLIRSGERWSHLAK